MLKLIFFKSAKPKEMWNWLLKVLSKKIKTQHIRDFNSKNLDREVVLDIYLPSDYSENTFSYPLLILNDGQDLPRMNFNQILRQLYFQKRIPKIIAVGIHAADRMQEYGTAHQADYANRGSQAKAYNDFLVEELLPFLKSKYHINVETSKVAIAGFSLGGLSAFDIAWNNSAVFGKVGVFSGALWWRSAAFREEAPDADRIIHTMVRKNTIRPNLKFWLQTGTKDEEDDRNDNGIIDSIDDTMDLIIELNLKSYSEDAIEYIEVEDGIHHPDTWGEVMPQFLEWAFK